MSTIAEHPRRVRRNERDTVLPGRMSEREFWDWIDSKTRAEWVEGVVTVMAPANFEHSDINGWLYSVLRYFVEQRQLGVVVWDTFVRLEAGQRQLRIPDVFFISESRKNIIKKTIIDGPPDVVIEVVSPDSQSRDRRDKYAAYEAAGVREYWIVDPISQRVEAYALDANGAFGPIHLKRGRLNSVAVPKFALKPKWLFEKRPTLLDTLAELGVK